MDISRPGEAGVIAWCNSIRVTMSQDPGRQFLHEQIQEGFDFLDRYLENFLSVPKDEPVIELLKTPGRKKNVPARTRAATAAAAKNQAAISMSFEDGNGKENGAPINDFHKALLQAREKDDTTRPSRQPHAPFPKLKTQRIVTIADSPAVYVPEAVMEVDEVHRPLPALVLETTSAAAQSSNRPGVPADASKELSIIAEDDELVEGSRTSFGVSPPAPVPEVSRVEPRTTEPNETQDVFHDAAMEPNDVHMQDDNADGTDDVSSARVAELARDDSPSISATTFQTIPLTPYESDLEPSSARTVEFHTAPLPKVSLSPVPVEEEPHSHTAPLPSSSSQHEEFMVPLRDEPSAPIPGLSRKPSVSQFTGLPAPSPLRKSLRTPANTTTGNGASTTVSLPGSKRTSTSWLSKARETKALETTKRTSTLGLGVNTFGSNKRKSNEMLEMAKDTTNAALQAVEEDERVAKAPKLAGSPVADFTDGGNSKAIARDSLQDTTVPRPTEPVATVVATPAAVEQDGDTDIFTTLLKKNYGARIGKSMGKSLGGNAATALAEDRAAAEARVAERHKLEMGIITDPEDVSMTSEENPSQGEAALPAALVPSKPKESERRLSVSDLVPSSQSKDGAGGKDSPAFLRQPTPPTGDTSISTTPPHSPPRSRNTSFIAPSGPVFSRPPAPAPASPARTDTSVPSTGRDFKLPTTNPFSIPAAMALGMGTKFAPLSAQSSKASIFSDIVFDRPDASPAWMPSTQDTSYSAAESQPQGSQSKAMNDEDDLDEDDSWGVDDKFAAHQMWTPFGFQSSNADQLKDDTMTWSTAPSRSTSQKGADTGSILPTQSLLPSQEEVEEEMEEPEPERGFAERLAAAEAHTSDADEGVNEEADMAMEIDEEEPQERDDLEEAILAGKSTIKLVQPKSDLSSQTRSDSQQSMASTSSSQSNLGFLGQATKFVSSVLGGSKKAKPEIKSLQRAAAAANKQQEELEKKAQRLKEMENRRQQAIQRKAEEEKARQLDEERKIKEEAERRKREREEHTDKRPLRSTTTTVKKTDDDTSKRKIGAVPSQKSKDKETSVSRQIKPSVGTGPATSSKPPLKSALKQPTAGPSGSSIPATPGVSKVPAPKSVKHAPSSSNLKVSAPTATTKGKEKDSAEQTVSRPKTHAALPPQEPRVASESIELPDINSEYSDSEDEDRPKRDLPDWAKSPDIAAALQQQSTINPDDIFGPIGPLRMEEIFRTRHSRFRARTSSANWAGADQLTAEEEREYARRMGFR